MFFKKDSTEIEKNFLVKTCALLIHAAKIDENYTEKEEKIIKKTLLELNAKKETITQIINDAKSIEENSNQILDFTREVKNLPENEKIKIIPEMLNLLGCSKDNFKKLLQKMNYKIFDKDDETYFRYNPIKKFKS